MAGLVVLFVVVLQGVAVKRPTRSTRIKKRTEVLDIMLMVHVGVSVIAIEIIIVVDIMVRNYFDSRRKFSRFYVGLSALWEFILA
jgi:hypothetical protein